MMSFPDWRVLRSAKPANFKILGQYILTKEFPPSASKYVVSALVAHIWNLSDLLGPEEPQNYACQWQHIYRSFYISTNGIFETSCSEARSTAGIILREELFIGWIARWLAASEKSATQTHVSPRGTIPCITIDRKLCTIVYWVYFPVPSIDIQWPRCVENRELACLSL